jgi:outer membrane protein TolC
MKYKFGTFLSLIFLGLPLIAQTQYAFTIKDAVAFGLENHGNIKTAHFDEYIADREVAGLLAAAYPQINGSIDFQGNIERPKFVLSFVPGQPPQKIPVGQGWQHNAQVQLGQLIFDGTFFIGLEATRAFVSLSQLNTKRTENELINQVVMAYYTALIAKQSGELIDLNIGRLEKLYKDTDILYKNGLVELTDMERIQLSLNNLQTEKKKFERMVALSVELLKFQMGMSPDAKLILTDSLPTIDMEKDNWEAIAQPDFTKRVEFQIMKQQADLEMLNIRRYKVGRLPSIYGFAYYQGSMQSHKVVDFSENATFGASAAGFKVKIPIFDGFQSRAKIQQIQVNLKKIQISQEMLQNGLRMQMQNHLATMQNAKDAYKSQQENVALAKKIFNKAELKYKEGVGSSLEVNNAEVNYKEAERNLLNATFDYLTARLKIWEIKGELREKF